MTEREEIVAVLPPLHPGEVLRKDYVLPLGLTAGRIAEACGIAADQIERILAEEGGIGGDTAVRLGRVFQTGPELWMNLQSRYEIETARLAIGDAIESIRPIAA